MPKSGGSAESENITYFSLYDVDISFTPDTTNIALKRKECRCGSSVEILVIALKCEVSRSTGPNNWRLCEHNLYVFCGLK